jgi:hypothetical protein
VLIQGAQRAIHAKVIAAAVSANASAKPPLPVRIVARWALLRTVLGCAVAIGPLPEHAPMFARR